MNFNFLLKIYLTSVYSLLSWLMIWWSFLMTFYAQSIQWVILWYSLIVIFFLLYALIWYKNKKIILYIIWFHFFIIIILFYFFWKLEIDKTYKDYSSISLWEKYSYNLLNIYNERELINMWLAASKFLQIPDEQKKQFEWILQEIENWQNINLPSAIPDAILNKKQDRYILYTPKNTNNKNLIFILHWNAWWFLFYQKVFKSVADKYNYPIVLPQFWWWNWNEKWWIELIYKTYNDLLNKNIISSETKVTIIALSNWWVWVWEILKTDKKNIFSKIICISCVFDEKQYQKSLENISKKEFLILHWDIDDRTTLSNYFKITKYLPKHLNKIYKNQNHFLLLQEKDDILSKIESFIK